MQVMVRCVNQIDSVNAENKVLKTENVGSAPKFNQTSKTVQQLSKKKKKPRNEVVTRASKLDISAFWYAAFE